MFLVKKYWIVNGDKGEAIIVNKKVEDLEKYRGELKQQNPNKRIFFDYIDYGTNKMDTK